MKKIVTFLAILCTNIYVLAEVPKINVQVFNIADAPIYVEIYRGACEDVKESIAAGNNHEWWIREKPCSSRVVKIWFPNDIYANVGNIPFSHVIFTAGKDLAGYYVDQETESPKKFRRIRAQK